MNTKREMLFRENQRKLYIDSYLKKIELLFSVNCDNVNFLSLNESDCILQEVHRKKRNGKVIDLDSNDLNTIDDLIDFEHSYYVFIDEDWQYCGAILIENIKVFNKTLLLSSIKDNVVFIKKELDRKIEIDLTDNGVNYEIEFSDFFLR